MNSGEIATTTAEEVLLFWFTGPASTLRRTRWFPAAEERTRADREVKERFGSLVEKAVTGELDEWTSDTYACLSLIVILDQFSRHVYRGDSEKVATCDGKALPIAERFLELGWQWSISTYQHVFVLMPLRHSPTVSRLQFVLSEVEARDADIMEGCTILNRFRTATVRRLQGIQDESLSNEDDILERVSMPCDDGQMVKHPVFSTVVAFLSARADAIKKGVIVSLSGGVDSMVLAHILTRLVRDQGRYFGVTLPFVVAVHIDYANRKESGREADFLEDWCRDEDMVFRKRVVDEVKRGVTNREEYEEVARMARYEAYLETMKELGCEVVLNGHHHGDVQENVISNVMRGAGLLDLAGMKDESSINGVRIWRPMLSHTKVAIFDFAHKFGIPYFKDTTPSWSTRGKLRRCLIPLLKDMYGEGVLSQLSTLATQSHETSTWAKKAVFEPFWDSVTVGRLGSWFDTRQFRNQCKFFWSQSLCSLLHSMGLPMVRDKAIINFMGRIQDDNSSQDCWIELRREFKTAIREGKLYVLRPDALPRSYGPEPAWIGAANGQPTLLPGESVRVGPWIVASCIDEIVPEQQQQPFESMETFLLSGSCCYGVALAHTTTCSLLGELSFELSATKHLPAWRNIHPILRMSLPIVGPNVNCPECSCLCHTAAADGTRRKVSVKLTYDPIDL